MLKMKKNILLICLVMSLSTVLTVNAADWRTMGSDEAKLKNLVAAVPGTSHWMFEVGERSTFL